MTAVATYRDAYSKRAVPVSEKFYMELIKKSSSYNSGLIAERKMRLPFLDSQTGVAQNHSSLWHPYRSRNMGKRGGQLYSYPSKRWKKKKRSFPLPEVRLTKLTDIETGEAGVEAPPSKKDNSKHSGDMHQISAVENPAALGSKDDYHKDTYEEAYAYQYYDDWDQLSEPPDAGEIDARHSDSSDFEDTYVKKKKKKAGKNKGGRGKKKDMEHRPVDDSEKPYACEQCGARYKTRPGLSYHVTHSHNNPKKKDPHQKDTHQQHHLSHHHQHQQPPPQQQQQQQQQQQPHQGMPQSQPHQQHQPQLHNQQPPPMQHMQPPQPYEQAMEPINYDPDPEIPHLELIGGKTRSTGRAAAVAAAVAVTATVTSQNEASKYCDFCLGDIHQNKKTGQREDLVSCADCGRSGHPSCLQFTANMIISVKKYPWQCIECKSCGLCGTSDNDDQLLFCDDCDRGYHMYCLKPPLSEPPEGSWSCHLCIEEFYGGKKPDNVGDTTQL